MSEIITAVFEQADYVLLLILRVGGLVWSSPIFGRSQIPVLGRIGFMMCFSYLFFTMFPQVEPIEYSTVFGFFLRCAGEIGIGIILGYVTNLFFALPYFGGQMIDQQIGFGMVNVYDVQNNTQVPIVGNLFNMMLLVIFFMMDGHHKIIELMALTFEAIPVGNVKFAPEVGYVIIEVFSKAFLLGIMVGLPVICSGLTIEILMGTLIRSVPQMNMFVVGMPIKAIVGLVMVMVTIPAFAYFSDTIFSEMFLGVDKMFKVIINS